MACDQSKLVFCEGELDAPDVRALLEEHFARMRAGSPPEACHVLPIDGLKDPAVRLLSVRDENGNLLGVGKAMLDQLTALAREAGMTRLSCETGNSDMFVAANRLYENAGFVRSGPFGGYQPTDFTNFYTREI